jgi:hypothetical protein
LGLVGPCAVAVTETGIVFSRMPLKVELIEPLALTLTVHGDELLSTMVELMPLLVGSEFTALLK